MEKRSAWTQNQSKSPRPKSLTHGTRAISLERRLPWYHPDCRHLATLLFLRFIGKKGCDYSFMVQDCVGTSHLPYLPAEKLSSDSRSRRGSEAAFSIRTCTNHRIATGCSSSYYFRSTRARLICLLVTAYIAERRLSTGLSSALDKLAQ